MGYSPERVNPGSQGKNIEDIVKVVSGSDNKTAKKLILFIKASSQLEPILRPQ